MATDMLKQSSLLQAWVVSDCKTRLRTTNYGLCHLSVTGFSGCF